MSAASATRAHAKLGAAYAYRMALQYADVRKRHFRPLVAEMEKELGRDSTKLDFGVEEGADSHCQLGNLRLAQALAFDWLGSRFGRTPGDIRFSA